MKATDSGVDPGQRQLNGPQTTGREYRNLSLPQHSMTRDDDVTVPMRDAVALLADVHRPDVAGRFPVLIAASPYPRQIQNLGAPMGFIEACKKGSFAGSRSWARSVQSRRRASFREYGCLFGTPGQSR